LKMLYSLLVVLEGKGTSLVVVLQGKGTTLVVDVEGRNKIGRSSSGRGKELLNCK
jgi:hypothetical protein